MLNYRFFGIFLVLLFLAVISNSAFAQCAMCRSAVESTMSNGRNNAGVGLNTGILYLLVAPYVIVAAIGFMWYRTSKKTKLDRIAMEARLREIYNK
jgi:hypothetical protein